MRASYLGRFALVALLGIASDLALPALLRAEAEGAASPASSSSKPARPLVSGVESIEIVVENTARSKAFFGILGFTPGSERYLSDAAAERRTGVLGARVLRSELELGAERLALLEYLTPRDGKPVPRDTRGNDLWFQHVAIVVRDMDRAYEWLRAHRFAHVSSGPQTLPAWNRAAGGIRAFYFADPDGHTLELISFPKGKGHPRWHAPADCTKTPRELCLFLGIDHTAITVADSDQSLSFYRDRLGLRQAGASENYGPEQERLNAVFGARLRITALSAERGPGIELLEYLAPRGGRPLPPDARPNDLSHFQVVLTVANPDELRSATLAAGGRALTRPLPGDALVRDRDGHALFAHTPSVSRIP